MHIIFKNGDEVIHGLTNFVKTKYIGCHRSGYISDSYNIYEVSFTINDCIYSIRIAGFEKIILREIENIDKMSFIPYQKFYDDHEGKYENIVDVVKDFTQPYEGYHHQYKKTEQGYYLINGMYIYPDGQIHPENQFGYNIGDDGNIFDFWFYIRDYNGVTAYVSENYQNIFTILEQSVQSGIHDDSNLPLSNYDKVKFMKDVTDYSMSLNPCIWNDTWRIYSNTYKDVDFSEFV